jgi:hypothetical protein
VAVRKQPPTLELQSRSGELAVAAVAVVVVEIA